MDHNWDVWVWRRKKDVCPCSGSELMATVNLCLVVTFRGGNELPTAAATTKSHNKPMRRTTAVTSDLAAAVFSTGTVLVKRGSSSARGSTPSRSFQGFGMELIRMSLLFDEISSLSCLWGHRKCPCEGSEPGNLAVAKSPPASANGQKGFS